MAVSALPVLTDDHVRCAPGLDTTTSRLTPTRFQTVSEDAMAARPDPNFHLLQHF
jgi:hypothetical protein